VIDDELFVVLILEYQCKACWNRYCLVYRVVLCLRWVEGGAVARDQCGGGG